MNSDIQEKWQALQETIYRALMDSEFLEDLQNAGSEDQFEEACSALAHDVMVALGEGDVEPWTVEDRRAYQRLWLEHDIERAQRRLSELNK